MIAQPLLRKASLGAELESTDKGLKVVKLMEGTAISVKLLEGDLLQEINQTSISDLATLRNLLSNHRDGDDAEFTVIRKNKTVRLKGKFIGRPMETSPDSEIIYDQVSYKDGLLRVIINRPTGESKLPAMLFIPGYTCSSIDMLRDNHPYKRFIDAYVKAGFVTLRVEKSGLGDSQNTPSCESCDLYDEIENFERGLLKLKSLPYVDTNSIIIVGHSMGGVIAPALSAKHQVAGVVVYGTTAKSWFEYQLEMYEYSGVK
jgi:hypothetical protein